MQGLLLMILPWCFAAAVSHAQEPPAPSLAADRSIVSLKAVVEPLSNSLEEIKRLRKELAKAPTEEAKLEIQRRIDAERNRVTQFRGNISDIVGGAEAAGYEESPPEDTGLQKQISELLQPMLRELREATATPREMDDLRKDLQLWTERKHKADQVLSRIEDLNARAKDPVLKEELDAARRLWAGRQAEATGQMSVLTVRIEELERQQKPLWETLSDLFSRFFRSRGLNLLLALVTAVAGFIITRRIYRGLRKVSPAHRGKNTLTSRISDILAMVTAVFVAVMGILLVFYVRGDWLLLTLAAVMLLGAAWAGKTALPPYLDQIRMLLNLGSVREDERIVLNGLPWRVSSIGFLTSLTNPDLQGGTLRIPIRSLMGMTSREHDPDEPWFPSRPDDWVILGDGTYGKTITQTPEQVVVLRLGGSLKTYTTEDFLAKSPENLSRGFRIAVTFGIDYRHQADATTRIPKLFEEAITAALVEKFGREPVRSIQVEFSAASSSSLDYEILADFDGSLASRHGQIRRKIQKVCVDVCIAEGWVIPFDQITVHQA